jgi:hypothetical protein
MHWKKYNPPKEVYRVLEECTDLTIISSVEKLADLACGGSESMRTEVAYQVPGFGKVVEAYANRVRNGVSVNFTTPYMRRRDPEAVLLGDNGPTDKITYEQRFGESFSIVRKDTFEWLKKQPLVMFAFNAGPDDLALGSLVITPINAGFFAFGMALLQGIIPYDNIPDDFSPETVMFVAPPFRYTKFGGKQVVVHHRIDDIHEIFSYNLYLGPSAKKAIYSTLIDRGEKEGWITAHCSAVSVITPYDNSTTFMHEGASGAGKSEMLEMPHRESDGRLLRGENIVTGEKRYDEISRTCTLSPVVDDMALCHPSLQSDNKRLTILDAEDSWFVRTNHIEKYGTDVHFERLTSKPPEPLLFLNIDAAPGSRAMIWEHIEDAPGKPCPNPRVVIPRKLMHNITKGAVSIDIRSFGVRTPPCTVDTPSYGIIGLFHLLPPALAWIWRLVAPRGFANPSIIDTKGLSSEGVGSYWPFAIGRRVPQANLLLNQFRENTKTGYILTPNQYIGAWKVGFMPQWLTREYLARHGSAKFKPEQLRPSRCSLLGSTLHQMQIEGRLLSRWFLQVETQPEVGVEAYDIGATMLSDFFKQCLQDFLENDLDPLGKTIVECCMDDGKVEDYEVLIPRSQASTAEITPLEDPQQSLLDSPDQRN